MTWMDEVREDDYDDEEVFVQAGSRGGGVGGWGSLDLLWMVSG